jgi:predicted molibdopterin-dependent oxidoreductase YjgC
MSYELLRTMGAIQWPCTDTYPKGRERQYEDGVFNTFADECETYGHDLATGAAVTPEEYAARDPKGRAVIKGAEYLPPPEQPDRNYPFLLTTGRVTHQFHSRTKTGRSPALNAAAPMAFLEISDVDAAVLGIGDGDEVEVRSRRGHVIVPARLGGVEPGVVFLPFHYGDDGTDDAPTAANRLTISGWDAVSKQPHFKYGAVAIARARTAGHRTSGSDVQIAPADRLAGVGGGRAGRAAGPRG